ncbi:helix-turn-helix transcriptional regulator [Planomicrobium okeanokoites]|uniref:Helix-turn-helix transcriptional regulator n=1 Tax=Planomicrobium okeanokoites TaxID=244 RepID=A0ABV7KTQ4_PLAOK|nr:helix-turn-helix transcriptional regulator [Planomicrobium okeanokoites]TAA65869.1 transcriptional regulator [Planomicrobium okeanokoites]
MRTKIKEYRAKYGFTQADLAMRVGARRETISFLEKGEYNPSLKLAVKIAQQFNVSVEELFIFEDSDFE